MVKLSGRIGHIMTYPCSLQQLNDFKIGKAGHPAHGMVNWSPLPSPQKDSVGAPLWVKSKPWRWRDESSRCVPKRWDGWNGVNRFKTAENRRNSPWKWVGLLQEVFNLYPFLATGYSMSNTLGLQYLYHLTAWNTRSLRLRISLVSPQPHWFVKFQDLKKSHVCLPQWPSQL